VGGSSFLAQCPPCLQASYPDGKTEGILFGKRKPRRLHSDTIKLQRHWEELGHVSWNTASAGTAAMGSASPAEEPHQLQTCTRAGTCCRGLPGAPATLVPAHLGVHFHLIPPAYSPPSLLPSLPGSERHLHWVRSDLNMLRPPAATQSLPICSISWSCGSEHPRCQSTQHLSAAWAIISSCPVKRGTVMVSPLLGHLHAGERMWQWGWSQPKSQYRRSFHFLYPSLERMWSLPVRAAGASHLLWLSPLAAQCVCNVR